MVRIPIIITGCQRSGTTLTSLILDSHPDIKGVDEFDFLPPMIFRYLCEPDPEATRFTAFKLPEYANLLPFIDNLQGRRILWCFRNPLDVVWSMVKLNYNVGNTAIPWTIHPRGGWGEIVNNYWALDPKQKIELSIYMNKFWALGEKFKNLSNPPENLRKVDRLDCVFIGALCWRIKNELTSLYKHRNIDFHLVKYDDLVTNPKHTILRMLDYIQIGWRDEVMMHHLLHKGLSIGNTDNSRAIDQNSLGEGEKNLSQDEQKLIKEICSSLHISFIGG